VHIFIIAAVAVDVAYHHLDVTVGIHSCIGSLSLSAAPDLEMFSFVTVLFPAVT
jgi:hypothetical protein